MSCERHWIGISQTSAHTAYFSIPEFCLGLPGYQEKLRIFLRWIKLKIVTKFPMKFFPQHTNPNVKDLWFIGAMIIGGKRYDLNPKERKHWEG